MIRIAGIDLDGVVFDAVPRLEVASQRVDRMLEVLAPLALQEDSLANLRAELFYSTRAFYEHRLMEKDTMMPMADEYLMELEAQGWRIVFVTSRPEFTRSATVACLNRYGLLQERTLVMKPEKLFIKTPILKAALIQAFACAWRADEVLYIDDEKANRESLQSLSLPFRVHTCANLLDAVRGE